MIVNVFYNKEGVGDILLIEIGEVMFENCEWECCGDVVWIFDCEIKELVGYNIFNSFNYFNIIVNGKVDLMEELVV